jgi:glycosyltransferase involved in cell wall biosynthesis
MRAILALSFHPAFTPPKSGGEERLFYILNGLSKYYDVTLVSFTHPNKGNSIETINHSLKFKEIRIPKTIISSVLHYFVNEFSSIEECSAVITSLESRFNLNFRKSIIPEIQKADIIFFESPFLYTLPKCSLKGKKIVYNAYNNEFELMKPVFSNSVMGKIFLKYVYSLEKKLTRECDLIFVVSRADRDSISQFYEVSQAKFSLAPNGIPVFGYDSIFYHRTGNKNPPICLFIGSYHPPNIEAVNQIVKISLLLPEIVFIIAGNVSLYFTHQKGLTEECEIKEIPGFSDYQDIRLIAGFHSLEYWDTTPIIWGKPETEIRISEKIESLSITLFSPYAQKFRVSGKSVNTLFPLQNGWNSIDIPISSNGEQVLILTCEKELCEQGRVLGIALKQIGYTKEEGPFVFDLIGSRNRISRFITSKKVYLLGQVSEEEKVEIYKISDVALNPMMSGSGTNIKVLGYLSAGIPTITTRTGARGLDLIDQEHALICDIGDFPSKIRTLISDDQLAGILKKNGRDLVEERYDWESIVKDLSGKIAGI